MTPKEYLEVIARTKMAIFAAGFGDTRLAFNAVASIDTLPAVMYW